MMSHNYHLSKKTFELTFGSVAAGGFIAGGLGVGSLERTVPDRQWIDQPALTDLVFEMSMLLPSAAR
jgi:hypothetical protein